MAVQPSFPAAAVVEKERLASTSSRVFAQLIDGLIVGVVVALATWLITLVTDDVIDWGDPNTFPSWYYLLYFGISIAYFAYLEGTSGQTIGKKALNIRVVGEADGQVIGIGRAALRFIAWIIDSIFLLGLWLIIFQDRKQRIGDMLGKDVVVRV